MKKEDLGHLLDMLKQHPDYKVNRVGKTLKKVYKNIDRMNELWKGSNGE